MQAASAVTLRMQERDARYEEQIPRKPWCKNLEQAARRAGARGAGIILGIRGFKYYSVSTSVTLTGGHVMVYTKCLLAYAGWS